MKAFVTSQFSYCPLVWIFHNRIMNNRINTLHKKALSLVYTNKPNLSFEDVLKEVKSMKIHQKNLQILCDRNLQIKKWFRSKNMTDIFYFVENPYNLRNNLITQRRFTFYLSFLIMHVGGIYFLIIKQKIILLKLPDYQEP